MYNNTGTKLFLMGQTFEYILHMVQNLTQQSILYLYLNSVLFLSILVSRFCDKNITMHRRGCVIYKIDEEFIGIIYLELFYNLQTGRGVF